MSAPRRRCDVTKLPRVLITFASALAFAHVFASGTAAQSDERPERVVREERPAPDGVEDSNVEKALVVFEGLTFFKERDVRSELNMRPVGGGTFDYDPARIEKAVRDLRQLYAGRGFMDASIEVREEPWSKPKLFTFVVSEGERSRLDEIRFEGVRRVPEARLAEALRQCLSRGGRDWREDYYADLLNYCVRQRVRGALASEGYLEAKAGELKVEKLERGLVVTVPIEEGARYRYGRIKVKGVTAFLPAQITEMMDARPGEVADGAKITEALSERLTEEYADRGYAQYSYEVEPTYRRPRGRKGDGVVDFKITVIEGPCFVISSISFGGQRLKTEDELRAALSLREGDVFGRRRFADGLQKLYEMGALSDYGEDTFPGDWPGVEYKLDEEKGLVAINIQVVEPQYWASPKARPK
jgi:outer membrane protein insertion porin family